MPTTAVPRVIAALLEGLTDALVGVTVYDGFSLTADPGDFLMVGVEDPDAVGYESSATSSQEWASIGRMSRKEDGEVVCAAMSWNGDADQAAAREAAYVVVNAVEDWLRANPTLGISDLTVTDCQFGGRHTLNQAQTDDGAVALVTFTVAFSARI